MRRVVKAWVIVGAPGVLGAEGIWWTRDSLAVYEHKYQSAARAREAGTDGRLVRCEIHYDDGKPAPRKRGRKAK